MPLSNTARFIGSGHHPQTKQQGSRSRVWGRRRGAVWAECCGYERGWVIVEVKQPSVWELQPVQNPQPWHQAPVKTVGEKILFLISWLKILKKTCRLVGKHFAKKIVTQPTLELPYCTVIDCLCVAGYHPPLKCIVAKVKGVQRKA